MSQDVVAFVERMWLDLWNRRAITELMDLLDPAYVQRDHRPFSVSGTSREAFRDMSEGWWALVPDTQCTELIVIAADPGLVAYTLRFEGTDSISGGRTESVMSVVTRVAEGRVCEAHAFDDAAEAAAHFATVASGP